MMEFTDLIKKISQDTRLKPDLLKAKNGNNFRAVSESAILDVIDPIFRENNVFYTVNVIQSFLEIKEAYGSKGKKLQFIAYLTLTLRFYHEPNHILLCDTDAVGMGIDDNDKAMGKAYTYAVKYALLKLFRLRFGDDSDFEESEPLLLEKAKENSKKEDVSEKNETKNAKSSKKTSDKNMTEAQRDYILGMMKKKGIDSKIIMSKFDGYDPKEDAIIPMTVARAMIKFLEDTDDLPF